MVAAAQAAQLAVSYAGVVLIGRTPEQSPAYTASGFVLRLRGRPVLITADQVIAQYNAIA
jgi:hypothetical protein